MQRSIAAIPEATPVWSRHVARVFSSWALSLVVGGGVFGCSDEAKDPTKVDPGSPDCVRDDHSTWETAVALTVDEDATGYICPVEDHDWYTLEVPASDHIVNISVGLTSQLSAVQASYVVWSIGDNGAPLDVVAQPPSSALGGDLAFAHCIAPGSYLLQVADSGDDAQDFRHSYTLSVTTQPDPDPDEPNDDTTAAVPISSGSSKTSAIACRSDQDWYRLEVPAGMLVRMGLTTASPTDYEPTLRLVDAEGTQLVLESNLKGRLVATEIERYEVVPAPGTYYVIVSDNDHADADPDVTYTLSVDLIADSDANEPNNHPDTATPITGLSCGASWSSWQTVTGTLGAPGDNDWFTLPLTGCSRGIIEAEATIHNTSMSIPAQWEFNASIQMSIALVRPHVDTACQTDTTCTSLNKSCEDGWGCAGLSNSCLPDGLCAGAVVCLPEGLCGANQVQRRYMCNPAAAECQPASGAAPPPNRATIAAPLLSPDRAYLRVADFQADGGAPDVSYTLRVRVRTDPDTHEPSNLYAHTVEDAPPVGQQPIVSIPVHDCTAGDCCGSGTWVQGALSYESDWDWYEYEHPCPDTDCTLRLVYDVDGGPVDTVLNIYHGSSLWFSAYDIDEQETQAALNGTLGGTTAGNGCFYAFQGHSGAPYHYRIAARDVNQLYPNTTIVRPESRDWSADQTYRFCVEKVSPICSEPPCQLYETGCGTPQ